MNEFIELNRKFNTRGIFVHTGKTGSKTSLLAKENNIEIISGEALIRFVLGYEIIVFTNIQNNGKCGTIYDPSGAFIYSCAGNKGACSYYIGTKKYIRMPYAKNFNQLPKSQGDYIDNGGLYKRECLPTPANKQPFPMKLNHNSETKTVGVKSTSSIATGCQTNYLTWQEAMNNGALPADWTPGN